MSRRMRLVLFTAAALGVIAALVVLPPYLTGGSQTMSLLSPGTLASAHAELEGEENCSKCHVPAGGMSDTLCLDCHEPLAQRIQGKTGYHANVEGACNDCHSDHHGLDYDMIRWPTKDSLFTPVQAGKAEREDFDHEQGTGFALTGAHDLACDKCHMQSLLVDGGVVEFKKEIQTYLGLGTDCASCHLNPHVPSQGDDCGKCHGDTQWKPADSFDHGDTRYPLLGKHEDVKCEECHLQPPPSKAPPPPPKPIPTFEGLLAKTQPRRYRGVGFGEAPAIPVEGEVLPGCTACHENPHRVGGDTSFASCADCHTPHAWDQAESAPFDHSKTGFPLDGAHARVSCADCHGEALNEPARKTCVECHQEDERKAHRGGFDREMAMARQSCEQCHNTEEWTTSTYDTEGHPLPLIERHDVACEKCHEPSAGYPRLPARPPARVGPLEEACSACHDDPHKGRLGNDCADCHGFKGWFNAPFTNQQHADIGFPIVDAHLQADCEGCHGGRNANGNLRKLALAEVRVQGCVVCHEDEHAGQLSTSCTECHDEKHWSPSLYDDVRHQKARMRLKNAHLATPCSVCHVFDVPPKDPKRDKPHQRFKWDRKSTCSACHSDEDPHRGQFSKDCGACHSDKAWLPSTFGVRAHARIGFPLVQAHDVACASCHVAGLRHGKAVTYRGIPKNCAGCHDDIHAGQFAGRARGCEACHTLEAWKPTTFDHDKKPCRFELVGAHKQLECTACHQTIKRGAREVVHYYPIEKRARCDDCHVNPHASQGDGD